MHEVNQANLCGSSRDLARIWTARRCEALAWSMGIDVPEALASPRLRDNAPALSVHRERENRAQLVGIN